MLSLRVCLALLPLAVVFGNSLPETNPKHVDGRSLIVKTPHISQVPVKGIPPPVNPHPILPVEIPPKTPVVLHDSVLTPTPTDYPCDLCHTPLFKPTYTCKRCITPVPVPVPPPVSLPEPDYPCDLCRTPLFKPTYTCKRCQPPVPLPPRITVPKPEYPCDLCHTLTFKPTYPCNRCQPPAPMAPRPPQADQHVKLVFDVSSPQYVPQPIAEQRTPIYVLERQIVGIDHSREQIMSRLRQLYASLQFQRRSTNRWSSTRSRAMLRLLAKYKKNLYQLNRDRLRIITLLQRLNRYITDISQVSSLGDFDETEFTQPSYQQVKVVDVLVPTHQPAHDDYETGCVQVEGYSPCQLQGGYNGNVLGSSFDYLQK